MKLKSHPILLVQRMKKIYGEDLVLTFSRYRYFPQSLVDIRESFCLRSSEVTELWLESTLESLGPGLELAFHSNVATPSGIMHIPMVDFATKGRAQLDKLRNFLGSEVAGEMLWFDSGRSFHGYGLKLIPDRDWTAFMGRLLLSNQPNVPPLIDPRWVGHRLIAGYSALRWSGNTDHYLHVPRMI
jgi:hypothetical protein